MAQGDLFAASGGDAFPVGWHYETDFLDALEEAKLVDWIRKLPLAPMQYKQFVARAAA